MNGSDVHPESIGESPRSEIIIVVSKLYELNCSKRPLIVFIQIQPNKKN